MQITILHSYLALTVLNVFGCNCQQPLAHNKLKEPWSTTE